jgi:hypothetical protein
MRDNPSSARSKNSKIVTISFSPADVLERAKARAERLGFRNSFSAYVVKLIEDDLSTAPPTEPPTKTNPPRKNKSLPPLP